MLKWLAAALAAMLATAQAQVAPSAAERAAYTGLFAAAAAGDVAA
ncbi:MAG: ankyrin repeat domain-containing protein, partial [Burkholderiales bacterium]|nr:ankyrin repeat domain-containing protein [Burkholderiales bacterium]